MTLEEIVEKARSLPPEGEFVVTVIRTSDPKNWDRVKVLPKLYGECVGFVGNNRWAIMVKASDVLKVLG